MPGDCVEKNLMPDVHARIQVPTLWTECLGRAEGIRLYCCARSRLPTVRRSIMCYFDQTRWTCGYWRWGHFRQQCNKEYRMGETCGLKLVYETKPEQGVCKLCRDMEKKQRRYDKMWRDVERWQREGGKPATVERTMGEMQEVLGQIYRLKDEHDHRLQSLGQV